MNKDLFHDNEPYRLQRSAACDTMYRGFELMFGGAYVAGART